MVSRKNLGSPRNPDRVIDYPMIDAGRTRRERNAEIIDLNLERAARSEHFETRVLAQFERDQRALDRPVENQVMANERRRTLAERRMRRHYAEDAPSEPGLIRRKLPFRSYSRIL